MRYLALNEIYPLFLYKHFHIYLNLISMRRFCCYFFRLIINNFMSNMWLVFILYIPLLHHQMLFISINCILIFNNFIHLCYRNQFMNIHLVISLKISLICNRVKGKFTFIFWTNNWSYYVNALFKEKQFNNEIQNYLLYIYVNRCCYIRVIVA